jgi:hypothetical protein
VAHSEPADVSLRILQVTADLKAIEAELLIAEPTATALADFLQAANHMRRTAWTAHQWVERSAKKERPFDLMLVLIAERVRVAEELCRDLANNLNSNQIDSATPGISALTRELVKLERMLATVTGSR